MTDTTTEAPRRLSHAESARTLLANARRGVLSTLDRDSGHPYGSVVELLPLDDGDAVVLLSGLAAHTHNFRADPRVSLLLAEDLRADEILALGRATYLGRMEPVEDRDRFREAYLELHPQAAGYVDFGDFAFYRLHVERARFIGGFGRMGWIDEATYHGAEPDPLGPIAQGVIDHMNEDHGHNLLDYARALAGRDWAQQAVLLRVDQHGFDMRVRGGGDDPHDEEVRIPFATPHTTSEQVHATMVRLAREARRA